MAYYLTEQLPSCMIERKLLIELEDYVKRKAAEFVPREQAHKLVYDFSVSDEKGREILSSVEEFKRSYFPDDTTRISIDCKASAANSLKMEIKFSRFRENTTLEVSFNGNSAREVTAGIAAEIKSILESYKTSNHWFHSKKVFVFTGLLYGLLYILSSFLLKNLSLLISTTIIVIVSIFIGILFGLSIPIFKPYSTFETRRNERRKKQLSWVLLGILGFILFTIIGVYFRQKIFGF